MKFSSKVLKCGLSPMRKFHPYAVAAEAKGKKIYHLNIGQPDIETPKAYFDAVKHFDLPVLAYAPSPGIPELIEAIRKYYADLDMHFDAGDILITNGGIVYTCPIEGEGFADLFVIAGGRGDINGYPTLLDENMQPIA